MTLLSEPATVQPTTAERGGRHRAPEGDAVRVATGTEQLRPGRHAAAEDDVLSADPIAWLGFRFDLG